jgi:DNA-binding response OmpR family regulator
MSEKPQPPKPCLLVVDDDSSIRAMLKLALGGEYEVCCLPNGKDVVAQIDAAAPQLLILDINMPGSDGYEICENVRAHAKNKKLPVLFMTARLDNARYVESLGAGGDSCIGKPFEMPQLRRCIEYLLSKGDKK